MTGTIVQVSLSAGGVPKRATQSAELTEIGFAGDSWRYPYHGGRRKALLLITIEGIDELGAQGFPLFPGALGENLTTRGLDRHQLRLKQRFRVGQCEIELTQIRTPCSNARGLWCWHRGCPLRCRGTSRQCRIAAMGAERLLRVDDSIGYDPRR